MTVDALGVTWNGTTSASTTIRAVSAASPDCAMTRAVPVDIAVTRPFVLTLATLGSALVHCTDAALGAPCLSTTTALSCRDCPIRIESSSNEMVTRPAPVRGPSVPGAVPSSPAHPAATIVAPASNHAVAVREIGNIALLLRSVRQLGRRDTRTVACGSPGALRPRLSAGLPLSHPMGSDLAGHFYRVLSTPRRSVWRTRSPDD